MYEISTVVPRVPEACSSILVRNKERKILHGRNLDFWPWKLFSKGSMVVEVYRGNEYVAEFDTISGAVFVLSGIKKGSFSVTVDTRKSSEGFKAVVDNIFVKKYIPTVYLCRDLL